MATTRYLGLGTGLVVLGVGMIGIPTAYFVHVARGLLSTGFTHEDVLPAFVAEAERGREERALERWRGRSKLEGFLGPVAIVGAVGTAASIVANFVVGARVTDISLPFEQLLTISVLLTSGVTTSALAAKAYFMNRRGDVDSEFWLKVWGGRVGKWAFRMAKKLLRGKRVATIMTHRATELALGMAAENLYETLPRETRESLRDLPPILRRLQEDAQKLRAQYNDLNQALSEAPDGGTSDEYADVREARDTIHGKLTEAVSALETVRLNLLRLHAGSATVEGLTTHLNVAADVSAEVERLLAAREEIERHLQFPREIATTPV